MRAEHRIGRGQEGGAAASTQRANEVQYIDYISQGIFTSKEFCLRTFALAGTCLLLSKSFRWPPLAYFGSRTARKPTKKLYRAYFRAKRCCSVHVCAEDGCSVGAKHAPQQDAVCRNKRGWPRSPTAAKADGFWAPAFVFHLQERNCNAPEMSTPGMLSIIVPALVSQAHERACNVHRSAAVLPRPTSPSLTCTCSKSTAAIASTKALLPTLFLV